MLIIILDSISRASVFTALFGVLFLITSPVCNKLIQSDKVWRFTTGDIVGALLSLCAILNFFTILSPYR